jgi:hypothetical protein
MTEDWEIRIDETDLNRILDKIDGTEGRNDALRDYIYALRDLQWAHNWYATTAADRAGRGDLRCPKGRERCL